jgi:hypothetical protein
MRTLKQEVLSKEAAGMQHALDELDSKIGQAQAQRESIAILLEAVTDALDPVTEEQLELPFPENAVEFPAHGAN